MRRDLALARAGNSILIVTASAAMERALRSSLGAAGHAVSAAKTAAEGIAVLGGRPLPAVLVIDLGDPTVGGVELRRLQMADPELRSMPTILYVPGAEPGDETARSGDLAALLEAVAGIVSRER